VARSQAETGKRALNSAAVIERGEIVFRQSKMLLPNYDVFDEARYFRPAERETLCVLRGKNIALTICEDAWNDRQFWKQRLYQRDPVEELFEAAASCCCASMRRRITWASASSGATYTARRRAGTKSRWCM